MEPRPQRIAVVGMGRSGTSFLAEFLAASGVYFDERSLPKKGKQRKLEHPFVREINDAILAERFDAKHHPPYGRLPEDEIEGLGEPWRPKVEAFVQAMDGKAADGGARYWSMKDPRTTILHSLWLDRFDVILGIFRQPADVVASYLAQGWIHGLRKRKTALGYWIRFNRSLLRIHEEHAGRKPMYVVDLDDDVRRQLENLCARLELPVDEEALALYRPSRISRRSGLLSRRLVSSEARATYDELTRLKNLL
jgi:hypothetical protein